MQSDTTDVSKIKGSLSETVTQIDENISTARIMKPVLSGREISKGLKGGKTDAKRTGA